MTRQKLIRNWRDGAGVFPGAVARYGQIIFSKAMMAMVGWLLPIAFSFFRKEKTKGDVLPQYLLLQPSKQSGLRFIGVCLGIVNLVFVSTVFAATGGGATIHNAATVTSSFGTATASVDVTVSTLAVSPQFSVNATAQTAVMTTAATYNYTLVNNSNGTDTFSITASSVDVGMVGPPGLNVNATATPSSSFMLGASITNTASDALGNIYIPADSEANLIVGDEIVISGVGSYTIASLTPGTPASTVAGITTPEVPTQFTVTPIGAAPVIAAGTVAAGIQLGEQMVFSVVVTSNTLSVPAVDGTHTVNLSGSTVATDAGGAVVNYTTSAGSLNETITTVTSASGTLVKEVRNVTTGTVFASGGGTLQSGDTLEYRITATPTPGAGNLLNSQVVDEVPTNTIFVSGSTTLNGFAVPDGAGATLPTTAANSGLQINSPTGAAGELVDGESAVLIFQVTVD